MIHWRRTSFIFPQSAGAFRTADSTSTCIQVGVVEMSEGKMGSDLDRNDGAVPS